MVNVAVVGSGYWGPNLIRNFHRAEQCRLYAVCDLFQDRLDEIESNYPGVKTTTCYQDLLDDGDVDAIVLATPPKTHCSMGLASLEAGKHLFVEKPLATSTAECWEMVRAAEQRDLVLMVGHTFLYNSAVEKVKSCIDSGEIGDVYYIYMQRLNLGRVRQDVNVVWNLAPHDISMALHWIGKQPIGLSARGYTYLQKGLEDVAYINLDFEDGVSAHIHVSWLDPQKVRRATVVGSKKMIVYDDVNTDAMVQIFDKGISRQDTSVELGKYDTFADFQLIHRAGDLLVPKVKFLEPLAVECGHFINCIRNGEAPRSDGRNGMAIVHILEKIQESLVSGGKRVELDDQFEQVGMAMAV